MASPFASLTTSDPIPLPADAGAWIKVRRLTGKEHDQAQESHRNEFASGRTNAWASVFRRALEKGASDPDVLKALRDPLTGYDRYVLVRKGLVSWSYPGVINKIEPPPDTYDAIRDLDDEAVDAIAREVLKLTKPALFQTPDEEETERKNDSRSFTAV